MTRPPDDPLSRSLEATLAKFARLVRQAGLRHGLEDQELDELFQDVRVRLWSALATGDKIEGVNASYVYRAARAACLDRVRRLRARREDPMDLERLSGETRLGSAPAADQAVERAELAEQLNRVLGQLTPTRQPVVRMYLAGYQAEEIGAVLGWPLVKTRNLLYRGLAELRERLQAQGIEGEAG